MAEGEVYVATPDKEIFKEAKKNDIICFSTPFDEDSVDFLEKLNCPMYKISSFEMTDIPLIKEISKPRNSSSKSVLIVNCQNNINISESIWFDKFLILENSSSFSEKFVLSNVKELIFLKCICRKFLVGSWKNSRWACTKK